MDIHTLDVIDLISERHMKLRSLLEEAWNEQSSVVLSNTEWHILSKIVSGMTVISDITKSVYITRQATHKHIKNLEAKNLVETYNDPTNKRNKLVRITDEGDQIVQDYNKLKKTLNDQLKQVMGEENFKQLKLLLRKEWL